jgi:hypothetical protein
VRLEDQRTYYVLARYFGIGAHEADHERPAWEINNLLTHWNEEQRPKGR